MLNQACSWMPLRALSSGHLVSRVLAGSKDRTNDLCVSGMTTVPLVPSIRAFPIEPLALTVIGGGGAFRASVKAGRGSFSELASFLILFCRF